VKVSLEYSNAPFNLDLAEIIQDINIKSKLQLTQQIEEYQQQMLAYLCGPKYSRKHSFKRAGTYTKELTTPLGTIRFKVQKSQKKNRQCCHLSHH